jgi:hypothetical protein
MSIRSCGTSLQFWPMTSRIRSRNKGELFFTLPPSTMVCGANMLTRFASPRPS